MYDRLAAVYPLSTMFFHSRAHRCALEVSGLRDGMRVLEVATGSGEMFRRLVRANASGSTVGVDLSPNMAARTQRIARAALSQRPRRTARPSMPATCRSRSDSFDAIFCCYLLELLSADDIVSTLHEFRRVLRSSGQADARPDRPEHRRLQRLL